MCGVDNSGHLDSILLVSFILSSEEEDRLHRVCKELTELAGHNQLKQMRSIKMMDYMLSQSVTIVLDHDKRFGNG